MRGGGLLHLREDPTYLNLKLTKHNLCFFSVLNENRKYIDNIFDGYIRKWPTSSCVVYKQDDEAQVSIL